MNEETMSTMLARLDEELAKELPQELPLQLPQKVEAFCTSIDKQFIATADRCDRLADGLSRIVDRLRHQSSELRENATQLPQEMRDKVRQEREFSEYASLYESLIE